MPKLTERGAAHLLVPLILLAGIIGGVYLVSTGNLKLFSKAANPPIVFKSTDGRALPNNPNGIPQTTSGSIKVEFTSTLGPPKPSSKLSEPVSGPVKSYTASLRFAENPTDLNKATFIPYLTEPTSFNYTFRSAPGVKFIWVEFKDVSGKTDRKSAQIELLSKMSSPIPKPTPFACTACNSDVNKSGSVNGGDVSYLIGCYNKKATDKDRSGKSCADRDINGNGVVDGYDFSCIRTVFNQKCQSSPTPLPKPSITVISPNGGENFKVGDTMHITWKSNNLDKNGSCIVSLVYDNGSKSSAWVPVNAPVGYYDWKLTSESGGRKAKVDMSCYDVNQKGAQDQSDNFFTVSAPTPQVAKRVFVTSTTYNGNLGGLSGADAKCQERAKTANLGGTWKAWLSSDNVSAASRLSPYKGPYKSVDGAIVANNWTDLTDGFLATAINVTERNTLSNSGWVWTNSISNGSIRQTTGNSCLNWTSTSSGGGTGDSRRKDSGWSDYGASACYYSRPLYCFEQ